jgi:hypothetical protein
MMSVAEVTHELLLGDLDSEMGGIAPVLVVAAGAPGNGLSPGLRPSLR